MNMFRIFMELDEAYDDRQTLIDNIKRAGKNYKFEKYTTAQLYRMWQKIQQEQAKPAKQVPKHELDLEFDETDKAEFNYCDTCGTRLSDGGYCPICDDGEEDF